MEIIKDLFFDVFLCGIALMFFSSLLLTAGMFLVKYFIWLDGKMFPIKNEGDQDYGRVKTVSVLWK